MYIIYAYQLSVIDIYLFRGSEERLCIFAEILCAESLKIKTSGVLKTSPDVFCVYIIYNKPAYL